MAPSRSIEPAPPLNAEDRVLWDVVEEHLDEAEFCFELFENQLDHPTLSLADLARGAEARLLAHIDALVIGGAPVAERLLAPQIAEADPERPTRVAAAALALVAASRLDLVSPALFHAHPAVRAAVVRACTLLANTDVDRWMLGRLHDTHPDHALQPLLEFTAQRGLPAPDLRAALRSSDPFLVASAARAARFADRRTHLAAIEELLAHADAAVRTAALITALAANSRHAWAACETWALDTQIAHPEAMTLYAALASPGQQAALAGQLALKTHRRHALFALGFSGNPTLVPALLPHLQSADPREAKLAAQAISTITGLALEHDEFAVPAPDGSEQRDADDEDLPPLADDLDGDWTLAPEDALPLPDATAVLRYWERVAPEFRIDTRYLAGERVHEDTLLDYLASAPLRRRHVLALGLLVTSGGSEWLDTRAFTHAQRARLAALRAARITRGRGP